MLNEEFSIPQPPEGFAVDYAKAITFVTSREISLAGAYISTPSFSGGRYALQAWTGSEWETSAEHTRKSNEIGFMMKAEKILKSAKWRILNIATDSAETGVGSVRLFEV